LGIIALRKIKQSHGAIGGKGFAIAGVIISAVILLFIIGIPRSAHRDGGVSP